MNQTESQTSAVQSSHFEFPTDGTVCSINSSLLFVPNKFVFIANVEVIFSCTTLKLTFTQRPYIFTDAIS